MAVPLGVSEEREPRRLAGGACPDASFERFFAAFRPRVRGLLRKYVGDVSADDLTQETLLRAHRRGLHLESGRDPWPWLARVARNLATDEARCRAHRSERPLGIEDDACSDATPHSEWVAARRREGIAEVLASLPPQPRRMLVARHLEGMRYEQIAGVEGVSVAAVRSALYRARRVFREEYGELAERRGIAALVPGLSWLRERVEGLRRRTAELIQRVVTDSGMSTGPMAALVHGSATAVAAGALAAATPWLGVDDASARHVPEEALLQPSKAAFVSDEIVDRSGPTRAIDATNPAPRSSSGEPVDAPTEIPEPSSPPPPEHVRVEVDTANVAPEEQAPAWAEAEGGATAGGEGGEGRHRADVHVMNDPSAPAPEEHVAVGGSVGVECPPSADRGMTMSAACPVIEGEALPSPESEVP